MSHDTRLHRGVRSAIRPLVASPVTPNHLTTLRLAAGLGAAVALAHGDEAWRHAGAILWLVMKIEQRHGARAGELGAAAGFDPDDALPVLPELVWLERSDWLLLAAGLNAPAFAVFMALLFRHRLFGQPD